MTPPSRIRVSIDRLVLRGVDRADAAAVQRALAGEIAARLGHADASALAGYPGGDRLRLSVGTAGNAAELGKAAGGAVANALVAARRGSG